ncbi:MAG: domain containing protein, partial [Deltaproteobacteria bacterium]|nr:domain containing protein [Deltaproteobacteria bacterium]
MCPVCRQRPAEVGVLCEECRDDLSSPLHIMPEQLQLHGSHPTMAALVDLWGCPHRLDPQTIIGRQVERSGLAILESSVSRQHAQITLSGTDWTIRDLGSANGTYVDDKLIDAPVVVQEGDRVRFGQIAFYFIEDVGRLPAPRPGRTATKTIRPPDGPIGEPPPRRPALEITFPGDHEAEHTFIGLPTMTFRMHEPTGGGGGLIEVDGRQVQL